LGDLQGQLPKQKVILLSVKEEKGLGMRAEDVEGNNYFLGHG
jgi:Cu+-exporting ATPase